MDETLQGDGRYPRHKAVEDMEEGFELNLSVEHDIQMTHFIL